jgi:hypothetical protein
MTNNQLLRTLLNSFYEGDDGKLYWNYMDHLPMDECLGEDVQEAMLATIKAGLDNL